MSPAGGSVAVSDSHGRYDGFSHCVSHASMAPSGKGKEQHGSGNREAESGHTGGIPDSRAQQDNADDDQDYAKLQREERSNFGGTGDGVWHESYFTNPWRMLWMKSV